MDQRPLQERTGTRFAQSAGRVTRNANDRAVLMVVGQQLMSVP
jgi:Rad3-related DNA helicase